MTTFKMACAIFRMGDTYNFEGLIFEWHPYLGPFLCKKNGESSARRFTSKDQKIIERWLKLTKKQKEKTRYVRIS